MSQDKKPSQPPSVGRVVHYSPPDAPGEVWAATIARVNSGTCNLGGFNAHGHTFAELSVPEAPEGAQAGSEEARGCWSWPAFVPPSGASAKGGQADLQPTPRPSPTGEPQPPPRP
ncbi:MAG: hypothetical protein ACRCU1_01850 [Alsobacter sp.]